MAEIVPMPVILCWHMHQPEYRDLGDGQYQFPWTYLHAIKDYVDMAAHLEQVPGARAVVNFAPVLLEQIADYAQQLAGHLRGGPAVRDSLLAALAEPALPVATHQRCHLVRQCLRANRKRIIERFPAFNRLAMIADWVLGNPDAMHYLSGEFLADLLVWYHLGWIAETVRRSDARVQRLQDKGSGFNIHDRHELLQIILEMLESVLPRYRALAASGRVELAMSPYAHPILPL
ncbi:MAG TPA: glycoside hydrolase, partial [Pseudomonadales bacterium]|nr:glycoside hydrolase [Pseudomonadales bacterium]